APAVPAAPPLPEDVAGTAPAAAVAPTAGASGVGPGAPACIVTPVPGDTSGCALPNAGSAANAAAESMTARGGADAPQQAEGLLSGEEDAKRLAPENLGRPCSSGTAGP
ncbi:MAG: hypothetical protein M3N68_09835, partial [Actinomycetota bacterium]|nr:hypothetical protein [Actinomycetota bacterium]